MEKNKDCHFQSLSVLSMQKKYLFVSIFEHMNIVMNEKYFKNFYDNLNYYVSLVIYQTCENAILRNVHSLGWLGGSFDCVFTHIYLFYTNINMCKISSHF